jgi:hypothetical protein
MLSLIVVVLAADAGTSQPVLNWSPVSISSTPQPLMADGGVKLSAKVTFRGAVELTSSADTFGGLSGLRFWNGVLYAVSDKRGTLFRFTPTFDAKGTLVGVSGGEATHLDIGDAEALEFTDDAMLVSNEDSTTLSRFRLLGEQIGSIGERSPMPTEGWGLGRNKGFEALAVSKDCALAFSELAGTGFVGPPAALSTAAPNLTSVAWPTDFSPTDAVWLEPGKVAYVALRKFDGLAYAGLARVTMRECSVQDFSVEVLAQWGLPLLVDNSEALTVGLGKEGVALYLASDDNFRSKGPQRTVLYKFVVK